MAIVQVNEIGTGNRGSHELERWRRTYDRTFQVIVDDLNDGVQAVGQSIGITLGTPYITATEIDLGCLVVKIEPERQEEWYDWRVRVYYDSVLNIKEDQQEQNPLFRPARYSWRGRLGEEPVERDLNDEDIVNSARDPFDPPVMRRASSAVLTITRNESNPDLTLMDTYRDTYNSDIFMGFAAGKWITGEFSMDGPEMDEQIVHYVCSYSFELNRSGWDKYYYVDKGYNAWEVIKDPKTGQLISSKEAVKSIKDGRSLNGQSLLDGNGKRLLPEGSPAIFIPKRSLGYPFDGFKLYNGAPYSIFNF